VKYYLVAYNVLSTIGWSYILILTLVQVFNLDWKDSNSTTAKKVSSTFSRLLSSIPFLGSSNYAVAASFESRLPTFLHPIIRRAAKNYARVGVQTAFVQSFALLEVLHVLLGWVRSPLMTTGMQVSSRLFLVWGIAEQFDGVSFLLSL
jgi:very-long-chain (3R)-3-hydroxyacyl-CoA dehydratase